jgi:hypothetical protein
MRRADESGDCSERRIVEIGIDMLASQAVIRAERPSFQQREGAVALEQVVEKAIYEAFSL